MLTILLRSVILFIVLFIVMRLMGKRQIGEMEPYELAITLVIAELACIPMGDKSIPLAYGIVSILAMYLIHQIILLVSKNNKMQTVISGKPVLVITEEGIDYNALQAMNISASDLLQAMRVGGHFDLSEIRYALFETNGQLSVLAKESAGTFPVPVILDGVWQEEELKKYTLPQEEIETELTKRDVAVEEVILSTLDEKGKLLVQTKTAPYWAVQMTASPTQAEPVQTRKTQMPSGAEKVSFADGSESGSLPDPEPKEGTSEEDSQ